MGSEFYDLGSDLEIPGLEAILEYGDADRVANNSIPNALKINDHARLERVRITQLDGLHDDPEAAETRSPNASRNGERAGLMFYRGRTLGLTGRVEAGNLRAMRQWWRKLRSQFGTVERDLLIHPPGEITSYKNEIWSTDILGWESSVTTVAGTTPTRASFTDGTLTGIESSWTNSTAITNGIQLRFNSIAWNGQDVWMTALAAASAAAASATSVSLRLLITYSDSTTSEVVVATQSSPVTGTYYLLTSRLLASNSAFYNAVSIQPTLRLSTPATNGTYTLRMARVTTALVGSDEASPLGYFGGETPGFEWEGTPTQSRSYGPGYLINQIDDPNCETDAGWANDSTSGATVDTDGVVNKAWPGGGQSSNVWAIHNPNTTFRTLAIRSPATLSDPNLFVVSGHRTYRAHVKLRVLASYTTGVLYIVWLNKAGTIISNSVVDQFDALTSGGSAYEVELDGMGTAPDLAQRAYIRIAGLTASNTASDALSLYVSEPRFYDCSDYDPDPDSIEFDSTMDQSHGLVTYTPTFVGTDLTLTPNGARRRIPRPYLLRDARKTSDMKAPEQQTRNRAWRDFSMSLRSSDPRVYVFDERHNIFKLSGSPQVFTTDASVLTPLNTAPVPVPVNFLNDGSANLTGFGWTTGATAPAAGGGTHPNGGVGHHTWLSPSGGTNFNARPSGDLLTRYYTSALGYTYTNPRVVLGCAPCGIFKDNVGVSGTHRGNALQSSTVYTNSSSILLKRVSSTTWLELRWNATAKAFWDNSVGVTSPYTFELWCSHNSSGTLTTTRLAFWDYSYVDPSTVWNIPFDPRATPMWLVAFLDTSNTVTMQLWDAYPSDFNPSSMIEQNTFTLPSGLLSVIGSAVAGNTGWILKTSAALNSTGWASTAPSPPFIHYFEERRADVPIQSTLIPVIGDVDTPQKIQLRGNMLDPFLTMVVPTEDGGTESAQARFDGTIFDFDPVTVNLNDGSVTFSDGSNAYIKLLPGSRFLNLRPGTNIIELSASDWDTTIPAHAVVSWRDALI